jgi:hypothetical protein
MLTKYAVKRHIKIMKTTTAFILALLYTGAAGAKVQALQPPLKQHRVAQDMKVPAGEPDPGEICRAGAAVAAGRRLAEIKLDKDRAKIYTVSYSPWAGAPPNARVYMCKLVNNAIVLGEPKGSKVKWHTASMSYSLNKAAEELSIKIVYSTGKSRTQTFAFEKLKEG